LSEEVEVIGGARGPVVIIRVERAQGNSTGAALLWERCGRQ